MSYSEKVLEHYENPRNVGKFDDIDDTIGTGMVGAPACFVGDTLIATSTFFVGSITLKEMYDEDIIIPVVSFNIHTKEFEPKLARCIKTGTKSVVKLSIICGQLESMQETRSIICTPDHKFLTSRLEYIECNNLADVSLPSYLCHNEKAFESTLSKNSFIHRIINVQYIEEPQDVYCLQVEDNNNFVVLTSDQSHLHNPTGIIVKNCGDVMKLQIKVDDDGIIEEARWKTYGCGSAVAASSLLSEWISGKTLEEAASIKNSAIAEELCLPP